MVEICQVPNISNTNGCGLKITFLLGLISTGRTAPISIGQRLGPSATSATGGGKRASEAQGLMPGFRSQPCKARLRFPMDSLRMNLPHAASSELGFLLYRLVATTPITGQFRIFFSCWSW